MSTRWCCRLLQDEFGPMDLDELLELVKSGTLSNGDLVRREGDDVWTVAGKCLELRETFRRLDPSVVAPPGRLDKELRGCVENSSSTSDAIGRDSGSADAARSTATVCDAHRPTRSTARQRWIAWSATAGLMLMLFVADRLIATATPTFPAPRHLRERLAEQHWFLGTGPWRLWECGLLWVDVLVVLALASGWLTRRLTN